MKNYIASTIVTTGIIILIFGIHCSGQTTKRLIADIPFEFNVGKEKLPMGRYEFEPANGHAHPGALVVRSASGTARRSWIVPASAGASGQSAEIAVMFLRYGTVHYLSRVNLDSGSLALTIRQTAEERELAKRLHRVTPVPIRSTSGTGR